MRRTWFKALRDWLNPSGGLTGEDYEMLSFLTGCVFFAGSLSPGDWMNVFMLLVLGQLRTAGYIMILILCQHH